MLLDSFDLLMFRVYTNKAIATMCLQELVGFILYLLQVIKNCTV
jgi:hypothetical protein